MLDRRELAAAPAVMAAIGAMGHPLVISEPEKRPEILTRQIAALRRVDWRRGRHWNGIAGKLSPSGKLSIGSSKETANAICKKLNASAA